MSKEELEMELRSEPSGAISGTTGEELEIELRSEPTLDNLERNLATNDTREGVQLPQYIILI